MSNFFLKVLPYFKKSESQNGRYSSDTKNHGHGGPLPVSDSIFVSPLAEMYGKMAKTFQLRTQDVNGDNQTGFDIPQVLIKSKRILLSTFFVTRFCS
jgi:hypothetical protein